MDSDGAWLRLAHRIITEGYAATARSLIFQEVMCPQARVDMLRPILTIPERRLGYRFMAAEAAWILSGDSRVESIKPYSKEIAGFSDDGLYFAGAYGPAIASQLPYVLRSLNADPFTRQALLTIWRPSPGTSKDIPCSVAVQFLQRGFDLHCVFTMRSSDVWLGVPYDWFNFSMLTAYVLLCLREMNPEYWSRVRPGALFYTAGSCHIYEKNLRSVMGLIHEANHRAYMPLDIDEFRHPSHLITHLWKLADGADRFEHNFGLETTRWKRETE